MRTAARTSVLNAGETSKRFRIRRVRLPLKTNSNVIMTRLFRRGATVNLRRIESSVGPAIERSTHRTSRKNRSLEEENEKSRKKYLWGGGTVGAKKSCCCF